MTEPAPDQPVPGPGVASHRSSDWTAQELLDARADLTVSVVIPARDEAATVGAVVEQVRRAWIDDLPLVDEIVVIDSDSTDDTAAVARQHGATAVAASDILPGLPRTPGKGEALWKALHVTGGDVLVFLDADLIDWGPHFVPGLLGPLLTDPGVALVKAVYDRPLLDEHGREAETGGRVTELVARPLLALHRPDLAGVVQPLSGEWAVRRHHLDQLRVPVGYGVEIAALIDTADRLGPSAVAQVDLGRRTHRHHRHDTLGPMAVQVMTAVESRRGQRRADPVGAAVELRQFVPGRDGFDPHPRVVAVGERPPAVSVPGYQGGAAERRGALLRARAESPA